MWVTNKYLKFKGVLLRFITFFLLVFSSARTMGAPIVNILFSPNDTICFGDTLLISWYSTPPASSFNYSFNTSNYTIVSMPTSTSIKVLFTASGNYNITVTANSTSGTGMKQSPIYVLPRPSVSLNLPFANVCNNTSQALSGGNPTNGTYWGSCVSGEFFVTPCSFDSSYVIYSFTNNFGCTGFDSSIIVINECISLKKDKFIGNINVYPNPIFDELYIDVSNISELSDNSCNIVLINNLGQKILFREIGNSKTILNCSQLSSGFYIALISIGHQIIKIEKLKKY